MSAMHTGKANCGESPGLQTGRWCHSPGRVMPLPAATAHPYDCIPLFYTDHNHVKVGGLTELESSHWHSQHKSFVTWMGNALYSHCVARQHCGIVGKCRMAGFRMPSHREVGCISAEGYEFRSAGLLKGIFSRHPCCRERGRWRGTTHRGGGSLFNSPSWGDRMDLRPNPLRCVWGACNRTPTMFTVISGMTCS